MKTKKSKNGRLCRAIAMTACSLFLAMGISNAQTVTYGIQAAHDSRDGIINDVAANMHGETYIAGRFNGASFIEPAYAYSVANAGATGTTDGFLSKMNRDGTFQWAVFVQGTGNDQINSVTVYIDGNVYICGTFNGSVTFSNFLGGSTLGLTATGGQDGFIAKYTPAGVPVWAYKIGSTNLDQALDVAVTTSAVPPLLPGAVSAIYLAGGFDDAAGTGSTTLDAATPVTINQITTNGDGFVARYLDNGTDADVDWVRQTGGTNVDALISVAADGFGNVSAVGRVRGTGNVIAHTNGSGGTTSPISMSGVDDIIAVRYDGTGTLLWHDKYGGASNTVTSAQDQGTAVAVDNSNNTYIGGLYTGTAYFGSLNPSVSNSGTGWDSFVACVDLNGDVSWITTGGTANTDDVPQGLAIDNCVKHLYVCGQYRGNFSFGGATFSPYNTGTADIDGFLIALDPSTGSYITGTGVRMGGDDGTDNSRAVTVNSVEDVYVAGSEQSDEWYTGNTLTFYNDDLSTAFFDGYLMKWDNIDFPVIGAPNPGSTATFTGVGLAGCDVYGTGTMKGATITFTSGWLASTMVSTVYTNDVFFTANDKLGVNSTFVALLNGTSEESGEDQVTDASGNSYVCGSASGVGTTMNFVGGNSYTLTGPTMAFVEKTNSSGAIIWEGHTIGSGTCTGYGVSYDASGNVFLCGGFSGTVTFTDMSGTTMNRTATGTMDGYAAMYNSSGVLQWVETYGAASQTTVARDITTDGTRYYITGEFTGTITMGGQTLVSSGNKDLFVASGQVSNGAKLKSISYGTAGNDIGISISCLGSAVNVAGSNNGSGVVVGRVGMNPGGAPFWLWGGPLTSTSGNAVANDVVYSDAAIYVSGTVNSGTFTIGGQSLSSGAQVFILRLSTAGAVLCLNGYTPPPLVGGSATSTALAVEEGVLNVDGGDNLIFGGHVANDNSAYLHLVNARTCTTFSERLQAPGSQQGIGDDATGTSSSINAYPNPANSSVTIGLKDAAEASPVAVVLMDMTGREVMRMNNIVTPEIEVSTINLSEGIYLCRILQNGRLKNSGKLVITH
ncbi:MAG: hypothetical protein K0S33_1575 [Bacteroidetes bacterium]|nr:hypothetical protein [Bacteroidota bacterium]